MKHAGNNKGGTNVPPLSWTIRPILTLILNIHHQQQTPSVVAALTMLIDVQPLFLYTSVNT